jgi:hypothetical protein
VGALLCMRLHSCHVRFECFLTAYIGDNDLCHLTTHDDGGTIISVEMFRSRVSLERSVMPFFGKKGRRWKPEKLNCTSHACKG